MSSRWVAAVAAASLLSACAGKSSDGGGNALDGGVVIQNVPPPADADGGTPDAGPPPVTTTPPLTRDHWTFYGTGQGLSDNVWDVSADEGGNVYVAGFDGLYAKRKGDAAFERFDGANSDITRNCYDTGADPDPNGGSNYRLFAPTITNDHLTPPGPAIVCPIVSVTGLAAGAAAIGFQGLGTDGDYDADWATDSGGADVVRFDAAAGKLTRTRHVFFATPPHLICGVIGTEAFGVPSCPDVTDPIWAGGRRKLRTVFRLVANHDPSSPMYGDLWAGGTHATFAALLNNAAQRGWHDFTAGQADPKWAAAKDVWEHDHPGIVGPDGGFLTGYTYAMSIDPRSGMIWASNGVRTAFMQGYGPNLSDRGWYSAPTDVPGHPWYDIWPDGGGFDDDGVKSMSHCADGTLWIASERHGLARIGPGGGVTGFVGLPDGSGAQSVACDPDGSLWIGPNGGGVLRLAHGQFTKLDTVGLPDFANQPVASIQIDRFTSPRTVYFAFVASRQGRKVVRAGGVASYDGP